MAAAGIVFAVLVVFSSVGAVNGPARAAGRGKAMAWLALGLGMVIGLVTVLVWPPT
jgi:hypothetical protein